MDCRGRDGHWFEKEKTIVELMMTSLMKLPCLVIFSGTDDIKVERKHFPFTNDWDVTVFEDFLGVSCSVFLGRRMRMPCNHLQ